jgi:hypothetical protein
MVLSGTRSGVSGIQLLTAGDALTFSRQLAHLFSPQRRFHSRRRVFRLTIHLCYFLRLAKSNETIVEPNGCGTGTATVIDGARIGQIRTHGKDVCRSQKDKPHHLMRKCRRAQNCQSRPRTPRSELSESWTNKSTSVTIRTPGIIPCRRCVLPARTYVPIHTLLIFFRG